MPPRTGRGTFLGVEIGGTKLQVGVGAGDGKLAAIERFDVQLQGGATGILEQIEQAARAACRPAQGGGNRHRLWRADRIRRGHGDQKPSCRRLGRFSAGRMVSSRAGAAGRVGKRLRRGRSGRGAAGAGQRRKVVLFVTVGTGIGGGLVVDGHIYRGNGHGATEIGHLRPGLHADRPDQTVESLASGWGIAAAAQSRLSETISHAFVPLTTGLGLRHARRGSPAADRNRRGRGRVHGRPVGSLRRQARRADRAVVAQAAGEGNEVARDVLSHACQALGWGIAQAITLVSPEVIVIGGGVSLIDESLFLVPLRREIERYVFPPLAGTYQVLPAKLGEQVVVHGAPGSRGRALCRAIHVVIQPRIARDRGSARLSLARTSGSG